MKVLKTSPSTCKDLIMKNIKSHFLFTKKQRSGIFLLLLIILTLQVVWSLAGFKRAVPEVDKNKIDMLTREIDSLRKIQAENSKPTIYPFNPNFITDYKGYTLGMSVEEIDRLHQFRKKDQWVNSVRQFQQVTKVSDSLLEAIAPYFKFPEWVTNPKPQPAFNSSNFNKEKTYAQKMDLNAATAQQLRNVYGVGEKLSERIVKYRNKFPGGFIADAQLRDVFGLSPEVVERILNEFTVKTPRQVNKIKLNTATREQLVSIQYIDYQIAENIIEERTLREGFNSLDELTKVKDFPNHKIEIIKLYLVLD